MTMKTFLYFAPLFLLFTGAALAQNNTTRFTSAYTDLGKPCKTLRGTNGTDDASLCPGVGGYRVRIYSSAATLQINAERTGTDDSFPLATLKIDFDARKTRIEWRMANGKPFAAIIRVPVYGKPDDDNPYFGKVIGEELIIRGLKGFDIDLSVDAKTPNANGKARELADKAFH
jgi:hypothetical protein